MEKFNYFYFHTLQLTVDTTLGSKEVKLNVVFNNLFIYLFIFHFIVMSNVPKLS